MTRVRKARRAGRLACGHYVLRGELIASRRGDPWICIDCAIAEIRARLITATTEPKETSR